MKMKKHVLCLAAALALAGCGKGSADAQYVDLIHEATEAVREAPTAQAAQEEGNKYDRQFADFEKEHADELQELKSDGEAVARIQEAMRQYMLTRIARAEAD